MQDLEQEKQANMEFTPPLQVDNDDNMLSCENVRINGSTPF